MTRLSTLPNRTWNFVSSMYRMASEDPAFFSLQVARKLPGSLRRRLSGLSDYLPSARGSEILHHLMETRTPSGASSTFAEALSVARGSQPTKDAHVRTKARFDWTLGNVTAAITGLPEGDQLRLRYEDERNLLSGSSLSVDRYPSPDSSQDIDVLHVLVNSAPHTSSGYTVRTRAILSGQRDRGLKVAGVTRLGYPMTIGKLLFEDVDIVDGIPYFRLIGGRQPKSLIARTQAHADQLSRLVAQLQPSVLHATTNYSNAIPAQAVARAYGIPWVYEMRGQLEKTWVARHPAERQGQAAESELYKLMLDKETALAMDADALVVLSHVQRNDLIDRGVAESKIHVIPNAYTPADVQFHTPQQAREMLDLPHEFTVGTVTSVVDYEGLDTLVRAIKILRDKNLPVRAVIAGDGVSHPALSALVNELGLHDHVSLPGRVAREDSHKWYQALDLFAVPRKKTLVCETITPIKPIEAMSNGTPVVASDLPPLRELVVDSGAGIAFEPENAEAMANAIELLMTDAKVYETCAAAAIRNAADHTWDANMDRYTAMYRELGIDVR